MGKFLKNLGVFLATGGGILSCTFLTVALLIDVRFVGPVLKPFFFAGSVFWGLLGLTGLKMWRQGRRRVDTDEAARYKQALLRLAARRGGQVTALELASELGVDVELAREYLLLLVGTGEVSSEISPNGAPYYQVGPVPEVMPPPPPPPPPPVPGGTTGPRRMAEPGQGA